MIETLFTCAVTSALRREDRQKIKEGGEGEKEKRRWKKGRQDDDEVREMD